MVWPTFATHQKVTIMKNTLFKCLLTLFIVFTIQLSSFSQIGLSLKAGNSLANIAWNGNTGSPFDIFSTKNSWTFGFEIEGTIHQEIHWLTGAYLQKATYNPNSFLQSDYELFEVLFLDIPVAVRFNHFISEDFSLFLDAGSFIGIQLADRSVRSNKAYTLSNTIRDEGGPTDHGEIKTMNVGLLLGGGAVYKNFSLTFHYKHGFTNIAKGQLPARTRAFNILLGYRIAVGKKA